MKEQLQPNKRTTTTVVLAVTILALLLAAGCGKSEGTKAAGGSTTASNAAPSEPSVELTTNQLGSIKIEPVGTFLFPVEKTAVGSITFDDNLNVQVFPPYQGKILQTFAGLGDQVQKGQPLYSIDSPDLIQAESTLISAAATYELTSKELARAKDLYSTNVGVSQRELEQAVNDQQAADGALKAARDAVRVFGKSEEQMDHIIAARKIDPALIVPSPITGEVTAYIAPPGLLAQPGTAPAPFAVADVSVKWMLANVIESDSPFFQAGQPLAAKVMAYPGRTFDGKVSKIYATVDPNTHRITIRSEIADPKNELRSGMLASFVIQVQAPVEATAIPAKGIVREGDGTFTAWITADRHHFVQKVVKIGLQNGGMDQVMEGLQRGQLVVSEGAVFLSNLLDAPPSD